MLLPGLHLTHVTIFYPPYLSHSSIPPHSVLSTFLCSYKHGGPWQCPPWHVSEHTRTHLHIGSHLNVSRCSLWGGWQFVIDQVLNGGWCSTLMWYWKHLGLSRLAEQALTSLFSLSSSANLSSFCGFVGSWLVSFFFHYNTSSGSPHTSRSFTLPGRHTFAQHHAYTQTRLLHLHHIWLWQGHIQFAFIWGSGRVGYSRKLNLVWQVLSGLCELDREPYSSRSRYF